MSAFKCSKVLTLGALLISTSAAFAQRSATATLFSDMAGDTALYKVLSGGPSRSLFPNNVDCRDFDKTGHEIWSLRGNIDINLGNWDGPFYIYGPIVPRAFVRKGIDLYDILESKCQRDAFSRPKSQDAAADRPQAR